MRTLLVMRHAKSSWKDSALADFDRPLNRRGRDAAPRMARLLVGEGVVPQLIVGSAAVRARETVAWMLPAFGSAPEVEFRKELYMAAAGDYLEAIRETADAVQRLMIVGHNPGLEDLVDELSQAERFPTAAIAHFEFDGAHWEGLGAGRLLRLQHLWRPRELSTEENRSPPGGGTK